MNKIYKVIWNKAIGAWVAVSENTKSNTKTQSVNNETTNIDNPRQTMNQVANLVMVLKPLAVALLGISSTLAFADKGLFINDGTDSSCTFINDSGTNYNLIGSLSGSTGVVDSTVATKLPSTPNVTGTNLGWAVSASPCSSSDKATQTNRALFYGSKGSSVDGTRGTDSLTLGSRLDVNGGILGLGNRGTNGVSGDDSMRIGTGTTLTSTTAQNSMAIGTNASATGLSSIAQGTGASASGSAAIAIGHGAAATKGGNIAIGGSSSNLKYTTTDIATLTPDKLEQDIGERKIRIDSMKTTLGSTTSSGLVVANVDGNILEINVVDGKATSVDFYLQKSNSASIITTDATTYNSKVGFTGTEAQNIFTALQTGASLSVASQTIAIGAGSTALRSQSIAIGAQASAYGDQSIALGANSRTLGSSSIAIGGDDLNTVSGFKTKVEEFNTSEIAMLYEGITGAKLVNTASLYKKTTSGEGAIAIGVQAQAADLGASLGSKANATGISSTAIGTGAQASKDGSIALGSGSTTDIDAKKVTGGKIGVITLGGERAKDVEIVFAGTNGFAGNVANEGRQVSVGSVGKERQIKNVAPGEISQTSTDAINGSQLVAVVEGVTSYVNNYYDDIGAVVYTQKNGTRVKKAADGKWYEASSVKSDGSLVGTPSPILVNDIITSVKAADGSTKAPTTLTNVAPAEISDKSTDAVNGSQLKAVVDGTTSSLGGGASYNPVTNTFTNPTYIVKNVAGNTVNTASNVGDGLTNLNTYINTGFDIQQGGTKISTVTPGSKVNYVNGVNSIAKVTTSPSGVTDITFDVDSQSVVNNAQIPIVYTLSDGTKVYKYNNKWYTQQNGTGTEITDTSTIITSIQGVNGSTTAPVKIRNVAKGDVNASSTDAINGSQLYGVSNSINTVIGGNSVVNPDGTITVSNLGDTGKDNIHDALKLVNDTANNANKGWQLSTNGGTASTVTPSQVVDFSNTDGNVVISNTGSNVTVNLKKDLDLTADGSVKVGQTTLNNDGIVINNTDSSKIVSITSNGVNAGNNKVINVADGTIATDSKDAVNGGQIKNIADSIKTSIGGNTTVNVDGSITTTNIGNTGKDNIHDAIDSVNTAAVKAKTTVSAGQNIVVTQGTNNDGSTNYEVKTADDVNFKNVNVSNNVTVAETVTAKELKSGNTTVNNNGVTINHTDPTKVVSVTDAGISAGNNKVTNVAPGTISSTSTDAVNGSQLNATNNAFNQFLGGGATYSENTKSYAAPTYNINNGTTTNTYNNVGDALGALSQADSTLNNRITNLGDQLEQSFRSTNNRIDDVEKRANAGIAAALALESAPYIAGKYTYAAGAAYHGDESAIGVTLRKTADNGRWSVTGGVAAAIEGDASFRIGISGVID